MPRRSRPPRSLHDSAQLRIPSGRPLRIVAVADTHSSPHPAASALIAKEKPDAIFHAGDIGALEVLDGLKAMAPLLAVRGNIDGRGLLPDSIVVDIESDAGVCLRMLLTHIAVAGPRLRADAVRLADRHRARLIVCGHSHVPFIGEDRGITVFNPGSIGPRRFSLPILFGLITVDDTGVTLEHISCETGERWLP